MNLYFPQYINAKSRFMTWTLVHKVLGRKHVMVDTQDDADLVIFSLCDVLEMWDLYRQKPAFKKPVLAGGAYAFNYWSLGLLAEFVWIGEVFDLSDCSTIDEIANSPHCYYAGKTETLYASQRIEWAQVPICQIDPKRSYYWGGVGCKNYCKFCFTKWTHEHQTNSQQRISAAVAEAKRRKLHLMTVSNQYDENNDNPTRDMLIVDYLKRPIKANMLRLGIEFPNEETRAYMGKPITDDQIFAAIQKSNVDGLSMKWFHITGWNDISDWEKYIEMIARMFERCQNRRMIQFEFNNLEYQNYTPLYDHRRLINPDNYVDYHVIKEWRNVVRSYTPRLLFGNPSPFQHAATRMGVYMSRQRDQLEFWLKMMAKKSKLPKSVYYKSLMDTGVMDTPKRVMNFKTGEITTK